MKQLPEVFVSSSLDEQELTINHVRGDDKISIYTSDNTVLTKLKKLVEAAPENYTVEEVYLDRDGNPTGVRVSAPYKCLSLRAGKEREMSDEQRAELAERMRNLSKK